MGRQNAWFTGSDKGAARPAAPSLSLSIANLAEIERSYGCEARSRAFERLCDETRRLVSRGRLLEIRSSGTIELLLDAASEPAWPRRLLDRLCACLSTRPVFSAKGPFFVLPRMVASAIDDHRSCVDVAMLRACSGAAASPAVPCRPDEERRYRQDMARSVRLLEKVDRGRALLVWQPIVSAGHAAPLLYFEGLLRIAGPDGELQACEADILALERAGMVPELDRRMISLALDQLEADPVLRLGVNISARSASLHRCGEDASWADLRDHLENRPDLARRLVIEITETAEFISLSQAREFVSAMQELGCQVAIDDFGAGRLSINQMAALGADIIKVDGGIIRHAMQGGRRRATFRHLVGLAASLARTVVVEGVETPEQAELARTQGVAWLQGYHFGRPSLSRTLTASEDSRAILALRNFRDRFHTPQTASRAGL